MKSFTGYIVGGVVLALCGMMTMCGFGNEDTPAGYVGYVTQDEVFGQSHFVKLQLGPTSTGLMFRSHVTNFSITPYSYDHSFTLWDDGKGNKGDERVVAKDLLKVGFVVHTKWHVGNCLGGAQSQEACFAEVKRFAETNAVVDPDGKKTADEIAKASFENNLEPTIDAYTREAVEAYEGLDLPNKMAAIGITVTGRTQTYAKNSPFVVDAVTVGAIQPPQNLLDAISRVQAKSQKISQMDSEIALKQVDKKNRIADALGVEKSMKELADRGALTDEYLDWEAIKMMTKQLNAPNHDVTFITDGVPVTGTIPVGKK